nr:hypothetical protein [Tanacetum cinerariifolium]
MGGRLSAPERIALSARVAIDKLVVNVGMVYNFFITLADDEWIKVYCFCVLGWKYDEGLKIEGHTPPSSSVPTTTLSISEVLSTIEGENFAHTTTKEPPSHTEGEQADMETQDVVEKEQPKETKVENIMQEHVRASSLPESVPFVNNMVIEDPEYGRLFINIFGDEAFQRMNDIHKVDVETLLTYLVMASNVTTPKNTRFCLKLRKLMESHPDQEKLKSKKVKLESIG